MKKIISFLFIAIYSTAIMAQAEISTEKYIELIQPKIEQFNEYYYGDQKNYPASEKLLDELIALYDRLEKEGQKQFKYLQAELYYALACCFSVQNKKEEAINAFEKAINTYGYTNYTTAKNDTDLDNIRTDERFVALLNSISEHDIIAQLRQAGNYQRADTTGLPRFTYQSETNRNLRDVRKNFNLDSVAGDGDEISKILNLLKWVQSNIRHDGSNYALCEFTSIDIYNYHKSTGKGVNCRALAMALNEIYLSMGFKSRYVTLYPKNPTDVHVINSVYSTTLNKWIWVDPTMNAYFKDENGNLLSIEEVRERVIDERPFFLNEDANWNGKPNTKESYFDNWLVRYLYAFESPVISQFNAESRYRENNNIYIILVPSDYVPDEQDKQNERVIMISDAAYFWEH